GEDIVFNYEVILKGYKKIGAVETCNYYYRRRSMGEASAIAQSASDYRTYTEYLINVLEKIILDSKDENGIIPKFIQYNIMGQLQWKFETNDMGKVGKEILGERAYRTYKEKAFSLLQYIDGDVIMAQKKIWSEHKYYILQKKYGLKHRLVRENNDIFFEFSGARVSTPFGRCYVKIEFLDITRGILHMEGFSVNFMPEAELLIFVNGEEIIYSPGVERDANKYIFDEIVFYATTFSADIPLEDEIEKYEIEFHGRLDGIEVPKSDLRFAKTMPLAQSYKNSFYTQEGWTVRKEDNRFVVYNMSFINVIGIDFEKEFEDEIIKSKNKNIVKDILELRRQALFHIAGKNKKKVWLISDRVNVAGDNGEAIFRFLSDNCDSEVEPYFIIEANSPDYVRMQSYGKVVPYGSKQHYLLHLIADYIVSSAADEFVINPWYDNKAEAEVVRDFLVRPKFIFLQHGVTKNDVSGWLNRYNKNIIGFVCAAQREAQSILDYNYYYNSENVWLTGFPRHDRLYHEEKKYITIMPTWRKWLAGGTFNKPGKNFIKSDYFQFYNELLNCSRLLDAAESYSYTICFMPHPTVQQVIELFDKDERVIFFSSEKPYSEIYAESNLVITDYSSACMDFALLRKPVVYCQFDEKQFFEEHTVKHGYFDYVEDGFGEVTYDMESLIEVIISYMESGCKVHEPYGSRMDNFFAFHDYNNCERVYKKIKELDG
ncbi:MAG: CDP-glycerol glycerophosphotransferase family protein, partial [Lachnospiraceae bacterium]|nr:CDP-glycerol glycerophosphotransferase family protein [Lachnospiraceae bacterium]